VPNWQRPKALTRVVDSVAVDIMNDIDFPPRNVAAPRALSHRVVLSYAGGAPAPYDDNKIGLDDSTFQTPDLTLQIDDLTLQIGDLKFQIGDSTLHIGDSTLTHTPRKRRLDVTSRKTAGLNYLPVIFWFKSTIQSVKPAIRSVKSPIPNVPPWHTSAESPCCSVVPFTKNAELTIYCASSPWLQGAARRGQIGILDAK
jgi:hypothetical protein